MSRVTYRCTHKSAMMGILPTGKQVTITGIDITRVAGGKAMGGWGNYDTLGMLQQLLRAGEASGYLRAQLAKSEK